MIFVYLSKNSPFFQNVHIYIPIIQKHIIKAYDIHDTISKLKIIKNIKPIEIINNRKDLRNIPLEKSTINITIANTKFINIVIVDENFIVQTPDAIIIQISNIYFFISVIFNKTTSWYLIQKLILTYNI